MVAKVARRVHGEVSTAAAHGCHCRASAVLLLLLLLPCARKKALQQRTCWLCAPALLLLHGAGVVWG